MNPREPDAEPGGPTAPDPAPHPVTDTDTGDFAGDTGYEDDPAHDEAGSDSGSDGGSDDPPAAHHPASVPPPRGRGLTWVFVAAAVLVVVAVAVTFVVVSRNSVTPASLLATGSPAAAQSTSDPHFPGAVEAPSYTPPVSSDSSPRPTTATTRSTPRPTTTRTTGTGGVGGGTDPASEKQASTVAAAWVQAVNTGDSAGVVAQSCAQDRAAYSDGSAVNPASRAGTTTLSVQRISIQGHKALLALSLDPAISGRTQSKTLMTQDPDWKVCYTQTGR